MVPAMQKVQKIMLFMKRTPTHISWQQLFNTRQFFKAVRRFLEIFQKCEHRENLIMQRHYIHTLYDEKHHIINISSKQEHDNSICINPHTKSRYYQTPRVSLTSQDSKKVTSATSVCVVWQNYHCHQALHTP